MPTSSFVEEKLRKLKENNLEVQKERVFYFAGSRKSIRDIYKCLEPGDSKFENNSERMRKYQAILDQI